MQNQQETPENPETEAKLNAFLTGALIAASALVGGLTVVLWNRRVLSRLRQQPEQDQPPPAEPDDTLE